MIDTFIDFIFNSAEYLTMFVETYGKWVYLLIFMVIFAECAFIIFPFLPGDGFVLTVGVIAGTTGKMSVWVAIGLMIAAAISGNLVNYAIGRFFGKRWIDEGKLRFVKQKHIDQTHEFFEKHGQKAVILSRFLPIFRTFVPFIAGISRMTKTKFTAYTIVGGAAWVLAFGLIGYYFGTLPWVQKNLTFIYLFLVVVTIIPAIVAAVQARRRQGG